VEFRHPDILDAEPRPQLNGSDSDDDLRGRVDLAENSLRQVCAYGRQLWTQLDDARHYLLAEVAGGEDGQSRAMLSDERAWQAWVELFAGISSVLVGTSGDSGFGRSEAVLVARAHGFDVRTSR
jgi:hypothetical protein